MEYRTFISVIASTVILVSVCGSPAGTARAQPLAATVSADALQYIMQVSNIGSVLDVEIRGSYLFASTRDPAPGYAAHFRAFNITDPGNPVQEGVYNGAAGEFSIDGDYAYVGASSLWVIRISDPANLILAGSAAPSTPLAQDAIHIDNVAYVANLSWGLAIFDTTNLNAPAYLGYRDTYYNRGYALSVVIRGNYLYVGCTGGVQIYEISNRTSPALVHSFATAQQVDGLSVAGDRLYVSAYGAGLTIFSLADPVNPVPLATLSSPAGGATKAAKAIGNRAFVADYAQVSVLDVSNPASGTIFPPLAQYSTTLTSGSAVNLDIRDDFVYVAANNGLLVLRYVPRADRAQQIETGENYACALTGSGGVKCWGDNTYGYLGNGLTVTVGSPVDVLGLTSGVSAISVGYYHSCALSNLGGVKCWGGMWGSTPVDATGLLSGVNAIAAGWQSTCVLTIAGGVKCFPHGGSPVDVSGLSSGVIAISAGDEHFCALTGSGGVKCWGSNGSGQLGNGTTTSSASPVDVSGLSSGVIAISAGGGFVGVSHTCALTGVGGVKCWGAGGYGQLGDGMASWHQSSVPVDVVGLSSGVKSISSGGAHTCAIDANGTPRCWGLNSYRQLGDAAPDSQSSIPVSVTGIAQEAVKISAGGSIWTGHTCAITKDGAVKCWGYNASGQLGSGRPAGTSGIPVSVAGPPQSVIAIDAGSGHTCVLTSANSVQCWGDNSSGQLGDGTKAGRNMPVSVLGLEPVTTGISGGSSESCFVGGTGSVKCTSQGGQAVEVSGLFSNVVAISTGMWHRCALSSSGGVQCWGLNGYGQLGDGTTTDRNAPVDVIGMATEVAAIAAGSTHTCALMNSGNVRCWGENTSGQLGDGSNVHRPTPVEVGGLAGGAIAVATGSYHTCALMNTGGLKCWGYNTKGQLGDGTTISRSLPVDVSGLISGTSAVAAGYLHSCAVVGSGVLCWGDNTDGQLGDGTTTRRTNPVHAVDLASGWTGVALGNWHTCALSASGAVKCWGNNRAGQLGNGTAWKAIPVSVLGFAQSRTYLPVLTR